MKLFAACVCSSLIIIFITFYDRNCYYYAKITVKFYLVEFLVRSISSFRCVCKSISEIAKSWTITSTFFWFECFNLLWNTRFVTRIQKQIILYNYVFNFSQASSALCVLLDDNFSLLSNSQRLCAFFLLYELLLI